jgi:hypothetical protein
MNLALYGSREQPASVCIRLGEERNTIGLDGNLVSAPGCDVVPSDLFHIVGPVEPISMSMLPFFRHPGPDIVRLRSF